MGNTMLHLPIRAHMKLIDGTWKMVDAEYADIPADAIARMLLGAFGVPIVFKTEEERRHPK